ncbi:hypothetical protein [Streptomyces sp. NPDC048623]|uniref:hypothetical protein n=1 Tax=Streptomyces sp. NPDC048623 TaxID=3155761 RepID=UPI0034326029
MEEIPGWLRWVCLGIALFQTVALVPVVRRMRSDDREARITARIDLVETLGSIVMLGSLALLFVAGGLVGFVVTGGAMLAKPVRWLLSRRRRPAGD